jgi:hypothetical protein
MKPLISLFAGLTGASAVMTGLMVLMDEKLMIGPFVGTTVALFGMTLGVKYVDWRLRRNILRVLTAVEVQLDYADYLRIMDLKYEINRGLSLTIAAEKLGELAHELEFDGEIESQYV